MVYVRVCAGRRCTVLPSPRLLVDVLANAKSSVYTRKNARPRKDRPVCASEEGEANLVSQLSKDWHHRRVPARWFTRIYSGRKCSRLDRKMGIWVAPARSNPFRSVSLSIKIPACGLRRLSACEESVALAYLRRWLVAHERNEMRRVIGEFWRRRLFTNVGYPSRTT